MKVGWWFCAYLHVFTYGDEAWHADLNQGIDPDERPAPYYCQHDDADGEPCMDSSHLIGPWETREEAARQSALWAEKSLR